MGKIAALSLATLLLLAADGASPQTASPRPWQRLQMPSAAQVSMHWLNPPSEYGPEPYFDMGGELSQPELAHDLDAIKALGFRAVTAQAGSNMPFAYLSPEYFKFFQLLVAEVKKRDMRLWIVDDAGYPSGFAGGAFTREKPELRMQTLGIAQTTTLKEGQSINQIVPIEAVAVTALSSGGATALIPIQDGHIAWTAPAGVWQVIVVAHRFETSPTRSALNSRPATEPRPNTNNAQAKDRSNSLEDYLNTAATEQFITFTHEQYKKYVGSEFGKTILGFRGDEPDFNVAGLPWTPNFFARFEQIKGYDIRPYLATFLQPDATIHAPEAKQARADYWDVFSTLFAEGFFKVQANWCAANHLEYHVHIDHEERQMDLTVTDGDFFRDMRSVQIPGIDMTRHQIWTDTISDFPRLASSAAHVYGKPRAFTESFASARPMPGSLETRYIINEQMVRGVNMVELMYFPSSGPGGRPAMAYMQAPDFPALVTYTRRLSYLMSMGRPTANVALYLPSSSLWLKDEVADATFVSTERMLSEHQINFDIVSEDALANDLLPGPGTFQTLSGNRFRTVIIPGATVLSQAVLQRLQAFSAAGGKVLFLSRLPSLISGRNYLNARAATPGDFSWATLAQGELSPTPTPSDDPPTHPPEPQNVPADILHALQNALPPQELTIDKPDTAWRVMPRRWKDAGIFLLFNEADRSTTHTVTIATAAKHLERWDPETGSITPLPCLASNGKLTLTVTLAGYETLLIVAR